MDMYRIKPGDDPANEFPVICACGKTNTAWEDFMRSKIIIECECGTRMEIDKNEWADEAFRNSRR